MKALATPFCYVYYCMLRMQLRLGATESAYVRFKARLLLGMIEAIWLINIALFIKIETGVDLVARRPLAVYIVAWICMVAFNRICLGGGKEAEAIDARFHDWPAERRAKWNWGVVLFVMATLAAWFFLLRTLQEDGLHLNWSLRG